MLRQRSVVNVAVDVGFHVLPRSQQFPEFLRIDQAARKVQRIAAEPGVVVRDDDRRLVGVAIKNRGQPAALFGTNRALSHHRLLQRTSERSCVPGLHDDVLRFDRRRSGR